MEIWKEIKGFNGKYQVSNLGNVRSIHQTKIFVLKPSISRGYKRVVLVNGDQRKTMSIHRLVALAFIPNPENKPQVNHKDENKLNNCVNNLEWVTEKENINWGTGIERHAQRQKITQKSKAVYQYDKSLFLVAVYPSTYEAERATGFLRSGIAHSCNKAKGFETYKGFIWSFEKIKNKGDLSYAVVN